MEETSRVYRIRTKVGSDSPNVIQVPLDQTYDTFEILSLNLGQVNSYKTYESDYGVIVGRVIANGGFGVPNAKVSVFIPVTGDETFQGKLLYNFTSVAGVDNDGVRYNVLPDKTDNVCHQDVGTFPNKRHVLDNNDVLEIFDKYWKYTTTTNHAGDYMIFGVPVGSQQLHVDIDLSDCGILSQRPHDMIGKGYDPNLFESPNKFKKSKNLNSLAQIVSQDKGVYVYPYWGDVSVGEDKFSITRCDITIEYKFESSAVFIGSIVTDKGSNAIGKNCTAEIQNGKMADLVSGEGTIEMIRKTIEDKVEEFPIMGNRLIDGDGVWCYQIPMNLDYVTTDEFGNLVPTDNPEKGIATRARVRFRVSLDETPNDSSGRKRARYLIPNNPRMSDEGFSKSLEVDYNFGSGTRDESYCDLFWNKVYTVKNYIPKIQKDTRGDNRKHTGIKWVNHPGDNNPMPYNALTVKLSFMHRITCILTNLVIQFVAFINQIISSIGFTFMLIAHVPSTVIRAIGSAIGVIPWLGDAIEAILDGFASALTAVEVLGDKLMQMLTPTCMKLDGDFCDDGVNPVDFYPGCGYFFFNLWSYESIQGVVENADITWKETQKKHKEEQSKIENANERRLFDNKTGMLHNCYENELAQENEATSFSFYNDWINGVLYAPLWHRKITPKKSYFFGLFKKKAKDEWCTANRDFPGARLIQHCAVERNEDKAIKNFDNEEVVMRYVGNEEDENICKDGNCHKKYYSVNGLKGVIVPQTTMLGQEAYYYKPVEYKVELQGDKENTRGNVELLFATDIVLLGSLNDCDLNGVPQFFKNLESSTYRMPSDILFTDYDFKYTIDPVTGNAVMSYRADAVDKTSEMAGCDWGNPNEFGKFDGGLFYGIGCTNGDTQLNSKSCINLSRACEFGVSLDVTREIPIVEDADKYKEWEDASDSQIEQDANGTFYKRLITDGYISWDELDNVDGRAMFATMNGNRLRTKRNTTNGLMEYDMRYLYPENFDGSLKNIMKVNTSGYDEAINYRFNHNLENPSVDYYLFRMGNTPYYYDGDTGMFPRYENSFYFYFGLKTGKTAIEKFHSKYVADCANDDGIYSTFELFTRSSSWCSSMPETKEYDGFIAVNLKGISTPYKFEIYGDNSYKAEDEDIYDEQIIFYYEGNEPEGFEGYKKMKFEGGEDGLQMIPNGSYYIEITDANGDIYQRELNLNFEYLTFDALTQNFKQNNDDLLIRMGSYENIINDTTGLNTSDTSRVLRTIGGVITVSDVKSKLGDVTSYVIDVQQKENFDEKNLRRNLKVGDTWYNKEAHECKVITKDSNGITYTEDTKEGVQYSNTSIQEDYEPMRKSIVPTRWYDKNGNEHYATLDEDQGKVRVNFERFIKTIRNIGDTWYDEDGGKHEARLEDIGKTVVDYTPWGKTIHYDYWYDYSAQKNLVTSSDLAGEKVDFGLYVIKNVEIKNVGDTWYDAEGLQNTVTEITIGNDAVTRFRYTNDTAVIQGNTVLDYTTTPAQEKEITDVGDTWTNGDGILCTVTMVDAYVLNEGETGTSPLTPAQHDELPDEDKAKYHHLDGFIFTKEGDTENVYEHEGFEVIDYKVITAVGDTWTNRDGVLCTVTEVTKNIENLVISFRYTNDTFVKNGKIVTDYVNDYRIPKLREISAVGDTWTNSDDVLCTVTELTKNDQDVVTSFKYIKAGAEITKEGNTVVDYSSMKKVISNKGDRWYDKDGYLCVLLNDDTLEYGKFANEYYKYGHKLEETEIDNVGQVISNQYYITEVTNGDDNTVVSFKYGKSLEITTLSPNEVIDYSALIKNAEENLEFYDENGNKISITNVTYEYVYPNDVTAEPLTVITDEDLGYVSYVKTYNTNISCGYVVDYSILLSEKVFVDNTWYDKNATKHTVEGDHKEEGDYVIDFNKFGYVDTVDDTEYTWYDFDGVLYDVSKINTDGFEYDGDIKGNTVKDYTNGTPQDMQITGVGNEWINCIGDTCTVSEVTKNEQDEIVSFKFKSEHVGNDVVNYYPLCTEAIVMPTYFDEYGDFYQITERVYDEDAHKFKYRYKKNGKTEYELNNEKFLTYDYVIDWSEIISYPGARLVYNNGVVTEYTNVLWYDINRQEYAFGVSAGDTDYIVTITEFCGDTDHMTGNKVSRVVTVEGPVKYKMYINDIDYEVIKDFDNKTGWNFNSKVTNPKITEGNIDYDNNPWFKVDSIYFRDTFGGDGTEYPEVDLVSIKNFTAELNTNDETYKFFAIRKGEENKEVTCAVGESYVNEDGVSITVDSTDVTNTFVGERKPEPILVDDYSRRISVIGRVGDTWTNGDGILCTVTEVTKNDQDKVTSFKYTKEGDTTVYEQEGNTVLDYAPMVKTINPWYWTNSDNILCTVTEVSGEYRIKEGQTGTSPLTPEQYVELSDEDKVKYKYVVTSFNYSINVFEIQGNTVLDYKVITAVGDVWTNGDGVLCTVTEVSGEYRIIEPEEGYDSPLTPAQHAELSDEDKAKYKYVVTSFKYTKAGDTTVYEQEGNTVIDYAKLITAVGDVWTNGDGVLRTVTEVSGEYRIKEGQTGESPLTPAQHAVLSDEDKAKYRFVVTSFKYEVNTYVIQDNKVQDKNCGEKIITSNSWTDANGVVNTLLLNACEPGQNVVDYTGIMFPVKKEINNLGDTWYDKDAKEQTANGDNLKLVIYAEYKVTDISQATKLLDKAIGVKYIIVEGNKKKQVNRGHKFKKVGNHVIEIHLNSTNITLGEGGISFNNCPQLLSITLPDRCIKTIGVDTFKGDILLTSVNIPDSVSGMIGNSAFEGCSALKDVYIPINVTGLGKNVFKDCTSLEKIVLPSNLTTIDSGCFDGCTSLTEVRSEYLYYGDGIQIANDAFIYNVNLSIRVPMDKNSNKYSLQKEITAVGQTWTNSDCILCTVTSIIDEYRIIEPEEGYDSPLTPAQHAVLSDDDKAKYYHFEGFKYTKAGDTENVYEQEGFKVIDYTNVSPYPKDDWGSKYAKNVEPIELEYISYNKVLVSEEELLSEFAKNAENFNPSENSTKKKNKVYYNFIDDYVVGEYKNYNMVGLLLADDFISKVNTCLANRRKLVEKMYEAFYMLSSNETHMFRVSGRTEEEAYPIQPLITYHEEETDEEGNIFLTGNNTTYEQTSSVRASIPTITYKSNRKYGEGSLSDEVTYASVSGIKKKPFSTGIMNKLRHSLPLTKNNADLPSRTVSGITEIAENRTDIFDLFQFPLIDKMPVTENISWAKFYNIPLYWNLNGGSAYDRECKPGFVNMDGFTAGYFVNGQTDEEGRYSRQRYGKYDIRMSSDVVDKNVSYIEKRSFEGLSDVSLAKWCINKMKNSLNTALANDDDVRIGKMCTTLKNIINGYSINNNKGEEIPYYVNIDPEVMENTIYELYYDKYTGVIPFVFIIKYTAQLTNEAITKEINEEIPSRYVSKYLNNFINYSLEDKYEDSCKRFITGLKDKVKYDDLIEEAVNDLKSLELHYYEGPNYKKVYLKINEKNVKTIVNSLYYEGGIRCDYESHTYDGILDLRQYIYADNSNTTLSIGDGFSQNIKISSVLTLDEETSIDSFGICLSSWIGCINVRGATKLNFVFENSKERGGIFYLHGLQTKNDGYAKFRPDVYPLYGASDNGFAWGVQVKKDNLLVYHHQYEKYNADIDPKAEHYYQAFEFTSTIKNNNGEDETYWGWGETGEFTNYDRIYSGQGPNIWHYNYKDNKKAFFCVYVSPSNLRVLSPVYEIAPMELVGEIGVIKKVSEEYVKKNDSDDIPSPITPEEYESLPDEDLKNRYKQKYILVGSYILRLKVREEGRLYISNYDYILNGRVVIRRSTAIPGFDVNLENIRKRAKEDFIVIEYSQDELTDYQIKVFEKSEWCQHLSQGCYAYFDEIDMTVKDITNLKHQLFVATGESYLTQRTYSEVLWYIPEDIDAYFKVDGDYVKEWRQVLAQDQDKYLKEPNYYDRYGNLIDKRSTKNPIKVWDVIAVGSNQTNEVLINAGEFNIEHVYTRVYNQSFIITAQSADTAGIYIELYKVAKPQDGSNLIYNAENLRYIDSSDNLSADVYSGGFKDYTCKELLSAMCIRARDYPSTQGDYSTSYMIWKDTKPELPNEFRNKKVALNKESPNDRLINGYPKCWDTWSKPSQLGWHQLYIYNEDCQSGDNQQEESTPVEEEA